MDRLSRKLDILQFQVTDLSSKLSSQLAINSVIAGDLRKSGEKIFHSQMKIAKNIELINEEHAVLKKQRDTDVKNVNNTLEVLKNRLIELDEYIANKLDQQLAIDSNAAAEFHSFAYEKYRLLETASSKQRDLLAQIEADQKELAARNIALLSDQVDLRNRLVRVENEQTECSCSELRMMIARCVADKKKLEKDRSELLNEHEKLRCKIAKEEAALRVEEVISEPLESREENMPAVITAMANALNLELRLEDIVDKPEAKSTCLVSSERLAEALIPEIGAKKDKSLPKIGPYYIHYVIAVVALIINLLGFTMFYLIFH